MLGHEIEETVTDPGAEEILGSGLSTTNLGGWYDAADANENGDKCAWVGEPLGRLPGQPSVTPIPGAMGDITGNQGTTFAVQSLWSNDSAAGAGYCAGAGTICRPDSPPRAGRVQRRSRPRAPPSRSGLPAASLDLNEGRDRRLSQRWQVLAGQPAHGVS